MEINISWAEFKSVLQNKTSNPTLKYRETDFIYFLGTIDEPFQYACAIPKDGGADQTDFEANYKANANKDVALKLAKACIATNGSGLATLLVKIPETRWVKSGELYFSGVSHPEDSFQLYVTDEDNLLGYGAGFVLYSFSDESMPPDNRGQRINSKRGYALTEPVLNLGKLPGNFYIKLVAQTGDNRVDTIYINVSWGT